MAIALIISELCVFFQTDLLIRFARDPGKEYIYFIGTATASFAYPIHFLWVFILFLHHIKWSKGISSKKSANNKFIETIVYIKNLSLYLYLYILLSGNLYATCAGNLLS